MAHTLHLELRDVNSCPVSVEIWCSCIADFDGSPCHLIGIQERDGWERPPGENNPQQVVQPVSRGGSSGSSLGTSDEASQSSGFTPPILDLGNEVISRPLDAAVVWVDPFTNMWDIQCHNAVFGSLGGPSATLIPFLGWIADAKGRSKLRDHVQALVNGQFEIRCNHDVEHNLGKINMTTPGLVDGASKLIISAKVSILISPATVCEDGPVRLTLTNLRLHNTTSATRQRSKVLAQASPKRNCLSLEDRASTFGIMYL